MISRKKDEIELVWHGQQENILKKWGEIGSSYRFMHDRAYLKFEAQNLRFALPVIVLSTIKGTANFAQASFPESWQTYVPLFAGFLNLSAGLITTIAQFLRVSELLEGHRAASIAYSKFSRNISVELSLPKDERSCSGREFVSKCRMELDRLIEQSPNIPLAIVKLFGKKFQQNSFVKPDILEISDVEVYKDSDKAKMLKQQYEHEVKTKELELIRSKAEYEQSLVKKIREEEIKRHADFDKKLQVKLHEAKSAFESNQKLRVAENKLNKKKKVGISTISKSMSSLIKKLEVAQQANDIITPESSDVDSAYSDTPITPIYVENEKISHSEKLEIIIEDKNDDTPGDKNEDTPGDKNEDTPGDKNDEDTVIDISNNSS